MADSRRVPLRLLATFAVLAIVAAGIAMGGRVYDKVLYLRYGGRLPPLPGPAPRDAVQARVQDLDYLAHLPEVDRSFTPAAAARFRDRIRALRAAAPKLGDARFFLEVAAAVALSDNAHTNVDAVSWRAKLASSPVRLAWFPEGLFVVRAMAGHEDLLGARVLAIDGRSPEALLREAATYFAGTAAYVRTASPLLLESPPALNALHADASAAHLDLRVEDAAGRARDVRVDAVPPARAPKASKPGRILSPVPLADEVPGQWRSLLDPAPALPSLREPQHATHAETLAGGSTLYLHLWRVRNESGERLADRIGTALGPADAPPWRRIVLDLRFDAGGDYPDAYAALRSIPGRLAREGRLMILTDETTFSAAIIAAVLARHFTGPRAVVVGSGPGDRLEFWAEGIPARLPNSGIEIGVSTGYHDWSHGCRELRCWWPNFYYDVAGGDLAPGIPVLWRFADYRRGVDTVLQRALE
jgi:hypothetical protein